MGNAEKQIEPHSKTDDARSSSPRVRILNDQVVNQIAAGEVVERPSSVVKELVENALDAGADEITVNIANGGKSLVEVSDNGHGMSRHDALLAIERFGTSKISTAQDLVEIASLGFRGEALPSIASVSEFTLETKADLTEGVQVQISGGKIISVSEASRPVGTKIRIKRLFFNTPARRKFLRTDKTEEGQIRATINDFALAYPQIRFRLVSDGKEIVSVVPAADLFLRAQSFKIAGKRPIIIDESFDNQFGTFKIQAVLSQPLECVAGSNKLRLMVNGRVVRDKLLLRAIRQGYGNFLKGSSYPSGVLSLHLPATEVDVNVHPQKSEVRFRTTDVVFGSIALSIKRSFEKFSILPQHREESDSLHRNPWDRPSTFVPPQPNVFSEPEVRYSQPSVTAVTGQQPSFPIFKTETEEVSSERALSQARYLGQILKLYLLFENNNALLLLDMHAAHERVRFFQIKQKLLRGGVPSQLLVSPETIEVPEASVVQAKRLKPMLAKIGIDYDVLDENCLIVRGIPAVLSASAESRTDAYALMNDLLSLEPGSDWEAFLSDKVDQVVARLACHSSIRSGRLLKEEEVYSLLESLQEAEHSGLCPHGRPVMIELKENDLEKLFGRVQ